MSNLHDKFTVLRLKDRKWQTSRGLEISSTLKEYVDSLKNTDASVTALVSESTCLPSSCRPCRHTHAPFCIS